MNNSDNNRSNIALALFLLAIGGAAVMEAGGFSVLLILLGLLFLVRHFDSNRQRSEERSRHTAEYWDYEDEGNYQPRRQAHSEPVYKHALKAVRRAGMNPDEVQVLTVDIGMMVFKDNEEPVVHRTLPVPDDVDYIQPYAQLRLPTRASGRVRFEVYDSAGELIFAHEDDHNLKRGRNLISPAARLPIHDERELDDNWTVRVKADGVLLAEHDFGFVEAADESIRKHIGEDGEITTELRAAMAESRLEKMSLDELLSFQEADAAKQQS